MAKCGCGRSPTGQCVGWHNLTEDQYRKRLLQHQQKDALGAPDRGITTKTTRGDKRGLTLSEKRARQARKKTSKKKLSRAQLTATTAKPTAHELNRVVASYRAGRLPEAETLARSLTKAFPSDQSGWKILGAIFEQQARTEESLVAAKKSAELAPQDGEAHYNLGNVQKALGRLNEAEASFKKAIMLSVNLAEAYSNLGATLRELGRPDEAVDQYEKAIALKPDYVDALFNLGNVLNSMDKPYQAARAFSAALDLKPDFEEAALNFGLAIRRVRFQSSEREFYPALCKLLTSGNLIRPISIAPSAMSLLKQDPLIAHFLTEQHVFPDVKSVLQAITAIAQLPLLGHLMRVSTLDLCFEGLFVAIRKEVISNLHEIEATEGLIYFLSSLALHCFMNEYIYFESDEEIRLVDQLEKSISDTLDQKEQPQPLILLCLASFRPLHQYSWCASLEMPDNLSEIVQRLIDEPLAEKEIAKDIQVLTGISDKISRAVKGQYEENPYPRWSRVETPLEQQSILTLCDLAELNLHSESIKTVIAPQVLVAGCGTGQNAIEVATRFAGCNVTAVDLSLASLAYAKRKSQEMGVSNVQYLQADILNLHQLSVKFDIINSVGVLHHMADPMAGWKILTGLLKPGGLMKIGLYSELARSDIVSVRKEIAAMNVGTSNAEMRAFRQAVATSNEKDHRRLAERADFHSLSNLRDLIFHVQEHRFTLPQIAKCLEELGLVFSGFENRFFVSDFRAHYGCDSDIYDLELWDRFEEGNPGTFAGMYQFWCQKI